MKKTGRNRSVAPFGHNEDLPWEDSDAVRMEEEIGVPRSPSASEALAAADERGYGKRRPRAKDPDASRRLVNHFLDQWEQINSDRKERAADSVEAARGYIRSTFISPSAGRKYTEDEVRAFIDQFMEAVHRGRAMIKPNQSAFMAFTGWWGRAGKVYRHDPGESRRYFEEEQRRLLTQERPPT